MRKIITPLLAFAAIAAMVVGIAAVAPSASAATEPSAAASQFFALLNQARADRGLAALTRDPGLDNLAVSWSSKMQGVYATTRIVSGTGDCSTHGLCHNPNLGPAVNAIDAKWTAAGENIGTGFDVQGLHNAFMNSPPHFENIVGDYNRLGVGVVNDGDGRIWVTFDFMKGPALAAAEPVQSQPLATSPHAAVVPLGGTTRFTVVDPIRVVDTRTVTGPIGAGQVLILQLAQNGFTPAGATSVVLNLTAIGTQTDGFLSAYPCGRAMPDVSSVNYAAGHAVPNLVTVALSTTGTVCIVASTQAHVLADLAGWYGSSGTSRYTPAAPRRLLDSRSTGRAGSFKVSVGAGAVAVTLNTTVVDPTGGGYVTAYPCGAAVPNASNLNFVAGQTVANQVTVRVGSDSSVCFVSTVATNLIVDLSGTFSVNGSQLTTVVPSRFLDTRFGIGGWMGRIGAGQTVDFALGGTAGIPSATAGVVLNVTVAGADASGFLTVYPCDQARPNVSNLNFVPDQDVANAVTVKLAANGRLCVYASSRSDVLVDLAGYLAS